MDFRVERMREKVVETVYLDAFAEARTAEVNGDKRYLVQSNGKPTGKRDAEVE